MPRFLDRADLIEALTRLIAELRARNHPGEIRIVGGAAIALSYFDRDVTEDIDLLNLRIGTNEAVEEAARAVANHLDLEEKWLNFDVTRADAFPNYGRDVEWLSIYQTGDITVQVPSPETLLVMKLRASRPGRDTPDIKQLLSICHVETVDAAEKLYESYYPGDGLTDRALGIVTSIFAEGQLPTPAPPPKPIFQVDQQD
jgi:hypothetical protein